MADFTTAGSTNAVLHLLAIANEAGVELSIDDFDDISRRTPVIASMRPSGLYIMSELDRVGGVPVILKELLSAGLIDGSAMTVRTALGLINQSLDEVLAEQEGEFDGDTRWALAWFEQFAMNDGPFGVAETLSKAKNTAVNALVEAGVVNARGGNVSGPAPFFSPAASRMTLAFNSITGGLVCGSALLSRSNLKRSLSPSSLCSSPAVPCA